jgi:tetrahydromethanopterin S-methyltransferase subunit G
MAEENNEHTQDNNNQGGENGTENTKKNVSYDDFKKLYSQFSDMSQKIDKILTPKKTPSKESSQDNGDKEATKDSESKKGSNDEKEPQISRKEFEAMQKKLDKYEGEKQTASLKSVAQKYAKEKGVNVDGFVDNLVGADEDTTKKNVDAFVKTISANQKRTTTGGFDISSVNSKIGSGDFLKSALEERYGK